MRIKVRLLVVGDGPYRKTLEELVSSNNVCGMVSFEGQKNKEEIVKYYQSSGVFILPSKKEGMPNVVLEAMACGLPIIMTPCEGSVELVQGNGFVVPTEKFGDVIAELARDSFKYKSMAIQSRRQVEEYFSWEKAVGQYEELMNRNVR